MSVQTSYDKNIDSRLAGLIYDMGNTNIDSFAAEGEVGYGIFVSRGSDPQRQVAVGGAGAIGISVKSVNENEYPQGPYDSGSYADTQTVGVMREGFIWAEFDAAGGTVDAAVTINGLGQVVAAGGATVLTGVSARVESPAIELSVGGDGVTGIFVGLVRIAAI